MKISQKKRKVGYTYSSVSGVFSFRGKKSIQFESTLERDLLMVLEYDPCVDDVIEQPMTILYTNANGNAASYTPDFLVHYHTTIPLCKINPSISKLIEVKPKNILKEKWPELKPKFKVGTAYAKSKGWRFCIYDEVKTGAICLKNIRFLKRYKRHQFDIQEESRILGYINTVGKVGIDQLLASLYTTDEKRRIAKFQIWHLLTAYKLLCDMTKPINQYTIIWNNIH